MKEKHLDIIYNADNTSIKQIVVTYGGQQIIFPDAFIEQASSGTEILVSDSEENDLKILFNSGNSYNLNDLIKDVVNKLKESNKNQEEAIRLINNFVIQFKEIYLIKEMALSLGLGGKLQIDHENHKIELEGLSKYDGLYQHFIDFFHYYDAADNQATDNQYTDNNKDNKCFY